MESGHAGICPALERHGKACHALFSREDVHLIQTTMEADGMLICARWDIVSLPMTDFMIALECTLAMHSFADSLPHFHDSHRLYLKPHLLVWCIHRMSSLSQIATHVTAGIRI